MSRLFLNRMQIAVTVACLVVLAGSAGAAESTENGGAMKLDIAQFGELTRSSESGGGLGVIWEDPREVYGVEITFPEAPPAVDTLRLEYWQSQWPHREIPRDAPSGAGSSGWFDVGDWFQGEWRKADCEIRADGTCLAFTFRPLTETEFPDLKERNVPYRTTLKMRLVSEQPLPEGTQLRAFSDTEWRPMEVVMEFRDAPDSGVQIDAFNGTAQETGRSGNAVFTRVLAAQTKRYNSFDETVVTVRNGEETFSFATADLVRWRHMWVPGRGALVRLADENITMDEAEAVVATAPEKDLYSRVADEPEQTFARAWGDMPEKGHHYIPLSFEGGRQHFGLDEHGNAFCNWHWHDRVPGPDSKRCLWDGDRIEYRFGLPGEEHLVERGIEDGCLPMLKTVWEQDGVRYTQTAFVTPVAGVPPLGERILAETPLALMVRLEMLGLKETGGEARLAFEAVHGDRSESLKLDGAHVFSGAGEPARLRARIVDGAGWREADGRIAYRKRLEGGATARLTLAIPYITLTAGSGESEWAQLTALEYDGAFQQVCDYWRKRLDAGTRVVTPEPMINDFFKAHVSHLLINTEREVGGSDRYMAKVGTFSYGAYTNESCMMIVDLDRRGYPELAARALQTWVDYQGTVGLPGDFSTTEGQFYGAGGYEDGGYNQHHGWALWCFGEHYWYTRDEAWLARVAPALVKGCDWVVNERRRTIEAAQQSPIRAIERGLLPPGRLEDIGDWRCWQSTNVFSWWGLDNAARALVAAGHPDGERLSGEADAYRADLLAAFTEAMRRSPVVRLRDGRWIPHVPADVHRRGRSFGWITETLEGAIHLIVCGAIAPTDPMADWIMEDYEDNLYLSEQFGYNLEGEDFERYWFSRGGISMQANLLISPMPYLMREQPERFLRAYFNAFAASYFPDTRMMTEHALPSFGDFRGDHYKTSDEANSAGWLRDMFLYERGDTLWVGAAVPRYWLADGNRIGIDRACTHFGDASVWYESAMDDHRITVEITLAHRNLPRTVRVWFRHPEGRMPVRGVIDGQPTERTFDGLEHIDLPGTAGKVVLTAYYE